MRGQMQQAARCRQRQGRESGQDYLPGHAREGSEVRTRPLRLIR